MGFKSGFVSIIGRPSSGKSTLINSICGYKVSIVSPYPQTTRFLIRGIYTEENFQIVFLDTPGYNISNCYLNKNLSNLAIKTIKDIDLILYLVDLTRNFGEEEEEIIKKIEDKKDIIIIAFNKIDMVEKPELSDNFINVTKRLNNVPYLFISGEKMINLRQLVDTIVSKFQEGPMYYPEEFVTDQSIPFRIEEIVREKIFEFTKDEVPHSVYIKVEDCDVKENKIKARATIFVERDSQKGIIIGKNGEMIKKIGIASRETLTEIFERKVELFLDVDVDKNWRTNEKKVNKLFNLEYK